ncbi:TTLL2 [Symbiodinium necroappetens]|uniref:Tubulin--tyrosine ligase-like protein 5 n=1 Tax=Symbiodinium necroappetens TaxID=1628268 RepID=A0A812W753_9DINO|nr:TTLL2 [Symbiodinium necroappetens]
MSKDAADPGEHYAFLLKKCVKVVETYDPKKTTIDAYMEDAPFLKDKKLGDTELKFIHQVFYGCMRYHKFLKLFITSFMYKCPAAALRAEQNIYLVLAYLLFFRLEELTVPELRQFLLCGYGAAPAINALMQYALSVEELEKWVKVEWCKFYDVDYVEQDIIGKLQSFKDELQTTSDEVEFRATGTVKAADGTALIAKSEKKLTCLGLKMEGQPEGPSTDVQIFRRSLAGSQTKWQAVEAMLQQETKQRFRPPMPERPPCKRFSMEGGCPFGSSCTHLHSIDGILDVRDGPLESCEAAEAAPKVFLHKMEDRKVGRGSVSLLVRTLATGGFLTVDRPEHADLLLSNAFPSVSLLSKLRPGCTINHWPGEYELCSKDRMARLLRGLPFCPSTYILPHEWPQLASECSDMKEALWISKPCQLGEGRHIQIWRSTDLANLWQSSGDAFGPLGSCVVSRYIPNPLLVEGRKIDVRVYAMVTSLQPLEAFVFREGLVRICGATYDRITFQDLSAHVSNNAVQTKASRHASGRNLTLQQLWDSIGHEHHRVRCGALSLQERTKHDCYSLLAFDLLIDDLGSVWILEVNSKPALHAQSPSLKAIFPVHFAVKANLLADLFCMVGLPSKHGQTPSNAAFGGETLGFERPRLIPEPDVISRQVKAQPVPTSIHKNSLNKVEEQKKKKLQEEKEKVLAKYDEADHFNLETASRRDHEAAFDDLKKQVESERMAECTFFPKTEKRLDSVGVPSQKPLVRRDVWSIGG